MPPRFGLRYGAPVPAETEARASGRGALLVGAGIFASRVVGLVRERVFAHYLGSSEAAGAFKAALRIPNLLQNLFGEGVLSASFIPVYASLLGRGANEEADRLASAIFGLLSGIVSILVLGGMLATPLLIDLIAPGFEGETRALTILLVRILFPGTGLLVLSAWCLGILNSHRRFFLSYAAPVIWNAAIIAALLLFGRDEASRVAVYVAMGTSIGCLLQLGAQVPSVLGLLGTFRPTLGLGERAVQDVLRGFAPVVLGRGVVQLSAYIDTAYASLISTRALAALTYAQILYLLPVSLFGMAVSAAELPEMSRAAGTDTEIAGAVRARVEGGVLRIAFFVIPSAVALLFFGDVLGATLFQTGRFTPEDSRYLWYILAGAALGLFASTTGRLYASAFYALKDTKTPLYFAVARVALVAVLGYVATLRLPSWLGLPPELGAAGITVSSGVAAWLENVLLRRALARRVGPIALSRRRLWVPLLAAVIAGLTALAIKQLLVQIAGADPAGLREWGGALLPMPDLHPLLTGATTILPFGLVYFAITAALGAPEARAVLRRVLRR
ncbi:MAG: murein biosynthesis integral membrane protein MurJ [Deltaproteobacteria bacterium]|nr:murein biosynthesis integral membrane protein MurJ [Deltaproteobacteria bacterium]